MKHHYIKTNGFTLAEVLITLGIIGVVAALTLPALIANFKDKELAVRAKKSYSIISQAIQKYQADNGIIGDVTGLFDTNKTSIEVAENFAKYFDGAYLCKNQSSGDCSKFRYQLIYASPYYDKDGISRSSWISYPIIVLKDSSIISINQNTSCEFKSSGPQYDSNGNVIVDSSGDPVIFEWTEYMCATITFDSNGLAKPNQFGADVFQVKVRSDGTFSGWSGAGWNSLKNILQGGNPIYTKYTAGESKD